MKKNYTPKSNKEIEETTIDVKNTIVGFINPDRPDQTPEETINEYFKKKEEEIEEEAIEEEEKKKKKKKLKEEQEELMHSIMVRIPVIEDKFEKMFKIETSKKGKNIKNEVLEQVPQKYNTSQDNVINSNDIEKDKNGREM